MEKQTFYKVPRQIGKLSSSPQLTTSAIPHYNDSQTYHQNAIPHTRHITTPLHRVTFNYRPKYQLQKPQHQTQNARKKNKAFSQNNTRYVHFRRWTHKSTTAAAKNHPRKGGDLPGFPAGHLAKDRIIKYRVSRFNPQLSSPITERDRATPGVRRESQQKIGPACWHTHARWHVRVDTHQRGGSPRSEEWGPLFVGGTPSFLDLAEAFS